MGHPGGGALERRRSLGGVTRADRLSLASANGRQTLAHVRVRDLAVDVVPRFEPHPNGGTVFRAFRAVGLVHVPGGEVTPHRAPIHTALPEFGAVGPHPVAFASQIARADPD